MMRSQKLLQDRDKSGFPLSVGTGLAFEAMFDPTEESLSEGNINKIDDLKQYSDIIINAETVLRNILSNFNKEEMDVLRPKDVLDTLIEELSFIEGYFKTNGNTGHIYTNSYRYFKDAYRKTLRQPKTPKQHRVDFITNYCLTTLPKEMENILKFTKDVRISKTSSALILTHVPADLLSRTNFSTLDLLESHTGVVKTVKTWNSKYFPVPGKDMSFLPFLEYLLTTFGDSVMFAPKPLPERENLYEQLRNRKVNPLTTEFTFNIINKKG